LVHTRGLSGTGNGDSTSNGDGDGNGGGGGDGWWQFAEAATVFKEAVAFREAHLPPDHPSTATTMSNLASTYSSLGQLDEVPPGRHRRCLPATQWYNALGDIGIAVRENIGYFFNQAPEKWRR
jgi:hypothetical protein